MPWLAGNFSRFFGATGWQSDLAGNIYILASRHDTHDQDLAGGIDACLTRDNQSKPTADFLPASSNAYNLGSASFLWKRIFGTLYSDAIRYDITPAETTASVTPTNYYIAPGDVRGSVLRYGAVCDGVTDDSAAIQRALNCKGLVTLPPGRICIVNSGLTIDCTTTILDGQGGGIKSGLSSGVVLTVDSSGGAQLQARNGLRNFILYGDLPIVGTVEGIRFASSSGNPVAAVNVDRVAVTFLDTGVRIHTNAFCVNFNGCMISNCNYGVKVTASSEKDSFNYCFLGSCASAVFSNASCQLVFSNCSIDYSNNIINMQEGWALLDNCYFENNLDTTSWFVTGPSENAHISIRGGIISNGGTKTVPYCSADAGSVIRFSEVLLYSSNNSVGGHFLGTGAGSIYAKDCSIIGFTQNSQCWTGGSSAQNLCDNGFFTAALTGWTLAATGGSLIPAFNAGSGSAGQGGMEFHTNVAATGSTATWTVTAAPGQVCGIKLAAKAENVVAKFNFVLQAIGGSGAVIATSDVLNGINQFGAGVNFADTSFHTYRNAFSRLPAGTTSVKAVLTSDYSAGWKVWISDVVICTY